MAINTQYPPSCWRYHAAIFLCEQYMYYWLPLPPPRYTYFPEFRNISGPIRLRYASTNTRDGHERDKWADIVFHKSLQRNNATELSKTPINIA